jgi:transposase-like protein
VVQGRAFKGWQFAAEVILWAVRWYLMFPVSYCDLKRMLQDRGIVVDHTRKRCIEYQPREEGRPHNQNEPRRAATTCCHEFYSPRRTHKI